MKRTHIAGAALGIALIGGGAWYWHHSKAAEAPTYRFATVERGNIRSTVSATGALSAVTTVQVGTQVSGQVSAIYADFNAKVKKGQLLARIDPTLQQQAVSDAQAGIARAQAQYAQAQGEYQRNKQLKAAQAATDIEYNTALAAYQVSQANLRSAEIALQRARQNLSYTSIYAPIDGVIVERNVDVGQTVAASFAAPQLFLIANDLAEMQILASVDESDIGAIRTGQAVEFTVQAYPNEVFTGKVQQVRLQSKTQDNVVNYTAVIRVRNETRKLLPGMTATVQFLTGVAHDVLVVPNAALRIRPTPAMLAQTRSGAVGEAQDATSAILWTVDAAGKLAALRVHAGLSDDRNTEVAGARLAEGIVVVIGVGNATGATGEEGSSSNPFQTPRESPRPQAGEGG